METTNMIKTKSHLVSNLSLELSMKISEYAIRDLLTPKEIEQTIKRVYNAWVSMSECINSKNENKD